MNVALKLTNLVQGKSIKFQNKQENMEVHEKGDTHSNSLLNQVF